MSNIAIATEFTPFEYLLISIANAAGEDKLLFEDRIEWVLKNAKNLHKMVDSVDDKPLFTRGLIELNNVRKGIHTGYMVGLDGTASGLQCLSVLTGCITTATNVGLVLPNVRCDIYTAAMGAMNKFLHESMHVGRAGDPNALQRKHVKNALMTHYYGSKGEPKNTFGKDSLELNAFYRALRKMNPGAEELMGDFMGIINNGEVADGGRLQYDCNMPDGFSIRSKVVAKKEYEGIEIDELANGNGNKSTITHLHKFVGRNDSYVSVPANSTHGVDSLVVREMHRRMKHDPKKLAEVRSMLEGSRIENRDAFVSLRMADWVLDGRSDFTESQCGQLLELIDKVTQFKPAPLATIHDEFKTYPSACGQMRYNYREIFAEISDSTLCQSMLRDLDNDQSLVYTKHSEQGELSALIRKSRYSIC